QAEHEAEGRDEQNPAADAEEAREDSGGDTERGCGELHPHQTSRRTPTPASRSAKESERKRPVTRCWRAVPATAPTAAGRPTIAAAPGLISPWKAYVTAPASAITKAAASEVAIAFRSLKRAARISIGTIQ